MTTQYFSSIFNSYCFWILKQIVSAMWHEKELMDWVKFHISKMILTISCFWHVLLIFNEVIARALNDIIA